MMLTQLTPASCEPQLSQQDETDSDLQLLAKIQAGERTAFWRLWGRYQDYLYRRCLTWMGGQTTEAEEAFSRAMLKAWEKLPQHAHKIVNPKAWLTRMTHNLCVDLHRDRKRQAYGIDTIDLQPSTDQTPMLMPLESPDAALLRHELRDKLQDEIADLPVRLREPFILRCCHQMSYRDMAKHIALSENNLAKRVQQARAILKRRLAPYLTGMTPASLGSYQHAR